MPLVRVQVKNEYGLAQPELYGGINREDPKAVLDGVAVAGLVGILRQLGDLADFAAEVFHGLQEQVMTTAARSHKLVVRVQNIEAALPSLEKAILAQTSHIHLAYTAGSEWHPRIHDKKNHFICDDLPRFIMDSYEQSRDPPHLHKLDKFDRGGPGSCLKRYSDPTFFKRESATTDRLNSHKSPSDKKIRKIKKKRSFQRNAQAIRSISMSEISGRMQYSSVINGTHSSQSAPVVDMLMKSERRNRPCSFDSRTESGCIDYSCDLSSSVLPEEWESRNSLSMRSMPQTDGCNVVIAEVKTKNENCSPPQTLPEQDGTSSSSVLWNEKTEIGGSKGRKAVQDEESEIFPVIPESYSHEKGAAKLGTGCQRDAFSDEDDVVESIFKGNQVDEIESEPDFVDALNTIESESDHDAECQTKREVKQYSASMNYEAVEIMQEAISESSDCHVPIGDSHTETHISSEKEVIWGPSEPVSSLSLTAQHMTENADKSSSSCSSSGADFDGSAANQEEIIKLESDIIPSENANRSSSSCSYTGADCNGSSANQEIKLDSEPIPENVNKFYTSCCSLGTDFNGSSTNQESIKLESEEMHENATRVSSPCYSPVADCNGSAADQESLNLGSVTSDSGGLLDSSGKKMSSGICDSGGSVNLSDSPVKFWTNGGLLGLQPSKPPDFTKSNAQAKERINGVTADMGSSEKDCSSMGSALCVDVLKERTSGYHEPWALAEENMTAKHGRLTISSASGLASDHVFTKSNSIESKKVSPFATDFSLMSTQENQENQKNFPQMLGLGQKFIVNGFRRKLALVDGEQPELANCSKSEAVEVNHRRGYQSGIHQVVPGAAVRKQFGNNSPKLLHPATPPLQHMKISFSPAISFESSCLTLKFSDGTHCADGVRDMFPSFQLVPQHSISPGNIVSDSDEDTFCRSSPISDDCRPSESNSEQWESDEIPRSEDDEFYCGLGEVSLLKSNSSSVGVERAINSCSHINDGAKSTFAHNGVEATLSSHILDLPSFDVLASGLRETNEFSEPMNLIALQSPEEPSLQPLPLPPVQWRISKPVSDVTGDQKNICPNLEGTSTNCLGPAVKQETNKGVSAAKQKSKFDKRNLDGLEEVEQTRDGQVTDEREGFLQQIRAKSFSLRRAVSDKPTGVPGLNTSKQVTAILQKASAIRQAVGSDNGDDDDDDDTWSDT